MQAMATASIHFRLKVHGGVTIQGYLDNTLALQRCNLSADAFSVELIERSSIDNDDWYQAHVRITPHGLRQNLRSFTSELEALLCRDPNILVLDREES